MRTTIRIIFLLAIFFTSCSQKRADKENLTREERIKGTMYRNLDGSESQKDSIKNDVRLICIKFENEIKSSKHLLLGIKKLKNGEFIEFKEKWNSLDDLKNNLNEIWRKKDFVATIAVYNSSSLSAQNGATKEKIVIQIENEEFTGTWTAFFDLPLGNDYYDKFELTYNDRN